MEDGKFDEWWVLTGYELKTRKSGLNKTDSRFPYGEFAKAIGAKKILAYQFSDGSDFDGNYMCECMVFENGSEIHNYYRESEDKKVFLTKKEFFDTFETPYLEKIEGVKQDFNLNAVPKDGVAIKFLGDVDEDSIKMFADSVDGIICEDNIVVINSDPFDFNIDEYDFSFDSWVEKNSDNEELIEIAKKLFSDFRLIKNGIDNFAFMASEESDGLSDEETFLENTIFVRTALSVYGFEHDNDSCWVSNPSEWFTDGDEFIFDNDYDDEDEDYDEEDDE